MLHSNIFDFNLDEYNFANYNTNNIDLCNFFEKFTYENLYKELGQNFKL